MTGSRFDRWLIWALIWALLCAACKPKAPAEPPGSDAADAGAPVTEYRAAPSPYEGSAFDGVETKASGHQHGHGHQHAAPKEAK